MEQHPNPDNEGDDQPTTPSTRGDFLRNLLGGLASDIVHSMNWSKLLSSSDLIQSFLRRPETFALLSSVRGMRGPVVDAMLENGLITEEEAAEYKDGGLSVVELLRVAMAANKNRESDEPTEGEDDS